MSIKEIERLIKDTTWAFAREYDFDGIRYYENINHNRLVSPCYPQYAIVAANSLRNLWNLVVFTPNGNIDYEFSRYNLELSFILREFP